jgi:AcrR family transcriptional regulator
MTDHTGTDPEGGARRCLRADAERNRARVVEAARAAFAEQGLDVSMNEIARRAGVGVATLFRRFPSRDELVGAVFADKMAGYAVAVEDALADPDAWRGFCGYIERVCAMQADDRGFAGVLTMTFPSAPALEAERNRSAHALTELLDRAKATGRLRADFAHQDVPLVLMANAGVVSATRDAAPGASARLVGYLLQSFAATAAHQLPPAPGRGQMYRALIRAGGVRGGEVAAG